MREWVTLNDLVVALITFEDKILACASSRRLQSRIEVEDVSVTLLHLDNMIFIVNLYVWIFKPLIKTQTVYYLLILHLQGLC